MKLICNSCGTIIETLPLRCGYSISINPETNEWECDLGKCGTVSFDNFVCEKCCESC